MRYVDAEIVMAAVEELELNSTDPSSVASVIDKLSNALPVLWRDGREGHRMNERTVSSNEDTWETNARYLLDRCPHTVRVCEGGGPENLMHSFVLTFMAMEEKLRSGHETKSNAETGALLCRYCPARFMTAWEHEVHEKEHAL